MIDISDYTFPDDCLNSLEAFEEFLSSRFASFDDCTANVGRRAFAKRLFELGKIDLLASLAHKYSAVMRAVRQAVVTGPEFPHMERLLQVLDAALPAAGVGGPPPVPALTGLSEGRKFGNGTAGATKAPKSKPEISGDHQT